MSKDIQAHSALVAFLEGGGTYTAALQALLKTEDAKLQKAANKDTIQARKDKLRAAIESYDVEKLVELQEKLSGFVDKIVRLEIEEPRQLTEEEVRAVFEEFDQRREIEELTKVRYENLRDFVFMSINEKLREQGLDPDVTNGELPIPGTDKVFRKEGAGRKEPDLDEDRLRALLSEKGLADEVMDEEVIPEQRVTYLNREKLMRLAQNKPEVMEMIREALIPGAVKTPRLNLRNVK